MDTIPISRAGRITRLIVIAVVAVLAVTMCFWRCSGDSCGNAAPGFADTGTRDSGSSDTVATEPKSDIDVELVNITNSITWEFMTEDLVASHIGPCVAKTKRIVENSTNRNFRLTVARHLADEVLCINLTNDNFHVRWQAISALKHCVCQANEILEIAGASQSERCEFTFDTLSNFKNGLLHTLTEKPIMATEADRYGHGPKWAQNNCKLISPLELADIPKYLVNTLFRRMYPKLSPKEKDYFKSRFREVFGIDYIPDAPGRTAYLKGDESTRWDGKGLKWRINDDKGNWFDADGKVRDSDRVREPYKVRVPDKDIEVFTGDL